VNPVPLNGGPIMILNGGPFMIMSDFAVLKWGIWPQPPGWVKVGQLLLDGTAMFAVRETLPDMQQFQIGYSANGDLFLVNTTDSTLVVPGPVGHCQ